MASIPASSAGLRPGPDDDREQRLNEVIAAYLEDREAGRSPDRSGLLARHPDLAADLASFFANQDHLDRLTAPLRDPVAPGDSTRGDNGIDSSDLDDPTPSVVPFPVAGQGGRPGRSRTQSVRYFGDYELMEIIAEGGMGVVYKATAGQSGPGAGVEDGAGPADSRRPMISSGSAWRRRPRRTWIILTSCRSTKSASTKDIITSA